MATKKKKYVKRNKAYWDALSNKRKQEAEGLSTDKSLLGFIMQGIDMLSQKDKNRVVAYALGVEKILKP